MNKRVPQGSNVVLLLLCTILLMPGCAVYWQTRHVETNLSPHVVLKETWKDKWFPFTGYAGEGGCCIIPFYPMKIDGLIRQEVYRNGESVWSVKVPWQEKLSRYLVFVSPDERAMYVEDYLHERSAFLVKFDPPLVVNLHLPDDLISADPQPHYPLQYAGWQNDSATVFVKTTNCFVRVGTVVWCWDAQWAVDAITGNVRFVSGQKSKLCDVQPQKTKPAVEHGQTRR